MYCECGCGEVTSVAVQTNTKEHIRKGMHRRFLRGHWIRNRFGVDNPNYKNGRHIRFDGYVQLLVQNNHPYISMAKYTGSSYYILEHRLTMAEKLGRPLTSGEVVHHINGIRDDNRIENLVFFHEQSAHATHHKKEVKDV